MSCIGTGCKNEVEKGHLTCAAHWEMLPRALQKEFYRARFKIRQGEQHRELYENTLRKIKAIVCTEEIDGVS